MKFSNGCWLQKEGCACFSPAEVYFVKKEGEKLILCAPTHKVAHRGDTLGGVNLTLDPGSMDADCGEEQIVVRSGRAKLVMDVKAFRMTYYIDDRKKCSSGWRDLAYMKTDWKGDAYVKSSDTDAYMRQQLSLGVGELIYGMGERFAAMIRNGQSVDIWNEDG